MPNSVFDWKPVVWSRTTVLLRQHRHPGADGRLDWGEHPGQGTRLGLATLPVAPPRPRPVPLGLRCPQLLLLLPVVRTLPLLLQTPALQRLQDLPAAQVRWRISAGQPYHLPYLIPHTALLDIWSWLVNNILRVCIIFQQRDTLPFHSSESMLYKSNMNNNTFNVTTRFFLGSAKTICSRQQYFNFSWLSW